MESDPESGAAAEPREDGDAGCEDEEEEETDCVRSINMDDE